MDPKRHMKSLVLTHYLGALALILLTLLLCRFLGGADRPVQLWELTVLGLLGWTVVARHFITRQK
jgi:hypothetical protein